MNTVAECDFPQRQRRERRKDNIMGAQNLRQMAIPCAEKRKCNFGSKLEVQLASSKFNYLQFFEPGRSRFGCQQASTGFNSLQYITKPGLRLRQSSAVKIHGKSEV